MAKSAWDRSSGNNTFLILGSRKTATPLSTLHPEPVQIFRFWQVYLDNVNPMLKVIHAPSMQARIVEAISDLESISPTLEALMFSIYCMSVTSLSVEDCQAMFNSSKGDLLTKYQSGCQQALLNSGFLRTSDRDCLTALYLYTVSSRWFERYVFIFTIVLRSRLAPARTPDLYRPCLASHFVLHNV